MNYQNGAAYVVMDEDGYLQLYTHTGVKVEPNIWLRVIDTVEGGNYVICKFLCNICSKEQMLEDIANKLNKADDLQIIKHQIDNVKANILTNDQTGATEVLDSPNKQAEPNY